MNYLYVLRPSPLFALARVLPHILLSIIFMGGAYLYWQPLCLGAVVCLLIAWYHYLSTYLIRYSITSDVLQVRTGIFFKQTDAMELFRIRDYVITQPLWMQCFKLMNLRLLSTDISSSAIVLTGIPDSDLTDHLRELVQQARLKNHILEIS
jgi:uncharacterized membrane protein YdbT with pleckstrin-like domain